MEVGGKQDQTTGTEGQLERDARALADTPLCKLMLTDVVRLRVVNCTSSQVMRGRRDSGRTGLARFGNIPTDRTPN